VSVSAASLKVGDTREQLLVDDLTRTQIVMYAGASGDYNPLHSDEKFAREVAGYPGIFAHGMLSMGMTGRIVTDWFGDGRLTKYGVRFVRQVWPGDTLTASATVEAIREEGGERFADVSIVTVNQDGTTVVSGTATARLDP
jgi:acyl dehydratase